jgi:NAD(P)H-dependent FMN reductase
MDTEGLPHLAHRVARHLPWSVNEDSRALTTDEPGSGRPAVEKSRLPDNRCGRVEELDVLDVLFDMLGERADVWNARRSCAVSIAVADMRVLMISGSLRARSTNSALLDTAERLRLPGIGAVRYRGLASLPHFDPDDDHEPLNPAVSDLRRQVHRADALLLSTPEYAGALPGSFKNALDWMIGDDQPGSISEKPVAWINTSIREARHAHESLRLVLSFANARLVEEACTHIPVKQSDVGSDGVVADPSIRAAIAAAITCLAEGSDAPTR